MPLDLSDDERAALISLLVGVIEDDPFPQSPRVQQLRGIVTKLRTGLANVNAPDDGVDPETTEPEDVDEAEVLRFGAGLSGEPQASTASKVRTPLPGPMNSPGQRSPRFERKRRQ
jgi:hypothetical protein